MPQMKSRHKHLRKTLKRTQRNRALKQQVKLATRAAREAAGDGDEQQTREALSRAYKAVDKATQAKVLHPRRGGRKKSVLARQVAQARGAE